MIHAITATAKEIFELTEEQKAMQIATREFAQNEIAPIAHDTLFLNEFSRDAFYRVIKALKIFDALGFTLPEEYGGTPISSKEFVLFVRELCKVDGSLGLSAGATISLVAHPLVVFGTEEQKQRWLPGICSGEVIGAYGQTTPESGSDVSSIATKAVERDGKWYITGVKRFITNGSEANLALVIARTSDDGRRGLTAFLVDCDKRRAALAQDGKTKQLDTSKNEHKVGLHQSPTTEMVFTDCEADSILGELGGGWKVAMATLVGSRATAIPAQALGIMEGAYSIAATYTQEERVQFGARLEDIAQVRDRRINMLAKIRMSEAVTLQSAALKDKAPAGNSKPYTLEASVAKLLASEYAVDVTSDAIQQLGGSGYILETQVGKFWKDARILPIYEGTSDIQGKVIIGELFMQFVPHFLTVVSQFSEDELEGSVYNLVSKIQNWPFCQIEGVDFLQNLNVDPKTKDYNLKFLMTCRRRFLKMLFMFGLELYKEFGMDMDKYVDYFKSTELPSAWFDLAWAYAVLEGWALALAKMYYDNDALDDEQKAVVRRCLIETDLALRKVEMQKILSQTPLA